MDDHEPSHDAFATDRLWRPSSFFDDPATYETSLFAPVQLDVPAITLDHPYAPSKPLDQELRLPDIDTFEFGPLPDLDSFDESSLSLDGPPPVPSEDVWETALELGPANKQVTFFTWELFEHPEHLEPTTPYITESGPAAFDAALRQDDATTPAGRVVRGAVLLESLWNLGLGRSSILFAVDAKLRSFKPTIPDGRASGISPRTSQTITKQFIHTGNTFLYLRHFVDRTFASSASIPARVALATAVSSLLSTFEEHLGRQSNNVKTILQLQRLFERPREILGHVAQTVDAAKHATSNEQLSSLIHHRLLEVEEGDSYIRSLSCQILRQVAQPSIELLSEWIGIRQEQESIPFSDRGGFVAINDTEHSGPTEYVYRSEMMPRFVSPEDGNTIFETGNALRFLKHHHPEHPLASLRKFTVQPPPLEWRFDWQDIEAISAKAKAYENELRTAILDFSSSSSQRRSVQVGVKDVSFQETARITDHEKYLQEAMLLFDGPPKQSMSDLPDEMKILAEQVLRHHDGQSSDMNTFSPPLSITSKLSFGPLLSAQAKLVNATTVRLFFRSHNLRLHLALQRQYQLLGDGVFSSGLASALFDPERESAERHKGKMRSGVQMGLQLGARETWPPASSELRLALMGLLSETYHSSALYNSTQDAPMAPPPLPGRDSNELPGQLNFSVRQLDESAMDKIMDPYGLYALDFLRLQYVPPSPLNLVITSAALDKYDYIFRFLLRLLRMIFVVAHLPRKYPDSDSRSFRAEAHHFVTVLSTYIFQTGIGEHWDAFQSYVTTLEHRLAEEDAAGELGVHVTEGLAAIRDAHEKCLDSILFSLLLRRRQRKVMALIEEIFELVLLFAKKQSRDVEVEQSAQDMYLKLRGKIRVFLNVCSQLTGKKGYGKGKGTAEEDTMERLGVLLEMNTYFSKSAA